jgi:ligand-binding sensor domain-containing protein
MMKNCLFISLVVGLMLSQQSALSQNPEWINYPNGNNFDIFEYFVCLALEGDCVWAGTNVGLLKIDKKSDAVTYFNRTNSGLPGNGVLSIAIDGSGNKWIGTGSGLAKFDGTNWTVYPIYGAYSITTDRSGNKWIGTGGGITKFDGMNWMSYNTSNSGLPNNEVRSIVIDGSGNKWIGTNGGGVARFDGTIWTVYNTSNSGLPSNSVSSIVVDGSGNKWIGTYESGIVKFDGTNWVVYNTSNSGLPENFVLSIVIDRAGNKWIGTYGGGTGKFDGTNWVIYNRSNSGLPDNDVCSIAIDALGNKWIETINFGLVVYHEGGVILDVNQFILKQNWPNPFNLQSSIEYSIPKDGHVLLSVYNLVGQCVRTLVNERQLSGVYTIHWDGRDEKGEMMSSGIYVYKISSGTYSESKRMILLK